MLIKLIIITITLLPSGLYKESYEKVEGYNTVEACMSDKMRVEWAYRDEVKSITTLISVNCIKEEEV